MSEDQTESPENQTDAPEAAAPTPEEEEMRRQMEEEIRKVRMEDLVLQSAVSLLNLAARRIGKEDERDLDQARIGIDAAEALSRFAPEEARPQIAQAVSELKLVYAKEADTGSSGSSDAPEAPDKPAPEAEKQGDSGLWTPGSEKS